MLEKLIYAAFGLVLCLLFYDPIYGICFLLIVFIMRPDTYAPLITQYHLNLVLGIIVLLYSFLKRIDFRRGDFMFWSIAFYFSIILSLLFAGGKSDLSLRFLFTFAKCIIFVIILLNYINTKRELLLLLRTCIYCSAGNAVFSVLQQASEIKQYGVARSGGTGQIDPNSFAGSIMGFIPIAYYFYLQTQRKWIKIFYLFVISLMVAGVMSTISRAGLVALMCMGGVLFFKDLKRLSTLLILGIFLLIFINYGSNLYEQRAVVSTTLSGKTQYAGGLTSRLYFWKTGLKLWLHNPIVGVGPYRFASAAKNLGIRLGEKRDIHNTFVHILTEQGLIGFGVIMQVLFISFRATLKLEKHEELFFREIARFLQIGMIGVVVCALAVSFQRHFLFWTYLTLPVILHKISLNKQES